MTLGRNGHLGHLATKIVEEACKKEQGCAQVEMKTVKVGRTDTI